jgi:lysyl-tRNA synthetase class 2
MAEKQLHYAESWPIDEAFIEAVGRMPPASGCALGLDRLIMLALGAPNLAQVQWRPPA